MNFKSQILAALKTKFIGVDERILGRVADKLAKTVTSEEQVATSVEGVTFQSVLESHGDSRATDASQTAVSNYEKKHNLKEGKPTGGDPVEPNNTDPTPQGGDLSAQITAAVTAAVKPLQDELATFKASKVSETRTQQLSKIIEKLPENLRKPYARLDVSTMTDDDFTTLTAEVQTEVEELGASITAKGAVFSRPVGGGGVSPDKPSDADLAAVAGVIGNK